MWNPIRAIKIWVAKKAIKRALGGTMFAKIKAALEGKKSYIVAVITAVIALLNAYGIVIPEWVLILLGALGITTIRAGVSKSGPPTPPQA